MYYSNITWAIFHDLSPVRENDGDLESDVNPLKAPKGNYHVVQEDDVYVLNRDTFAYFVKPKVMMKYLFWIKS